MDTDTGVITVQNQAKNRLKWSKSTCTLTRPDTRLPQLRAGGQGLNMRSLDHLGRSSEAKDRNNPNKVKCDGQTDRPIDLRTDRLTD